MKCKQIFIWSLVFLFFSCTSKEGIDVENQSNQVENLQSIHLQLTSDDYVDSAQVLFFRPLAQRDTLIYREIIYGVDYLKLHPFKFELPAGNYTIFFLGNVPTDRIISNPPYSSDDFYLDYADGQPGAVFYGMRYMNVGVDTVIISSMLLLSSSVKLTIKEVPQGIDKIVVRLLNTSSGVWMTGGNLEKPVDPPLSDTINEVNANSSYLVSFYCFPAAGKERDSSLEVDCLGASGEIVYSGQSAPFYARPGYYMVLSCTFPALTKGASRVAGKLHFKVEEK